MHGTEQNKPSKGPGLVRPACSYLQGDENPSWVLNNRRQEAGGLEGTAGKQKGQEKRSNAGAKDAEITTLCCLQAVCSTGAGSRAMVVGAGPGCGRAGGWGCGVTRAHWGRGAQGAR